VDEIDEVVSDWSFEDSWGGDLANGGAFVVVDGKLGPGGGE